jgi:hypothetical protein
MAFVKLFPFEGNDYLSPVEIIERLKLEFEYVEVDEEAGQGYIGDMIARILRMPDSLPGKQERLDELQEARQQAVFVAFGDDPGIAASSCLKPESEIFFGSPDEVDGPARALVERAAEALSYEVFEG